MSGAVRGIVEQNFNDTTETMMFCLRVLRPTGQLALRGDQQDSLRSVCVSYLERGVKAAEERLSGEIAASRAISAAGTDALFQRFWTAERRVAFASEAGRSEFVAWLRMRLASSDRSKADCFARSGDADAAAGCFAALPSAAQREAVQR